VNPLPIDTVIPQLKQALRSEDAVILSAEPGAGKTTRIPLALLDEHWLNGKSIIMLEPRRLAAIRAAEYMAQQLNQSAGETVGYRIRGESKISESTRLEILTEGILTRMIQSDPALPQAGLIIFDEFHERSINGDLGLSLTIDVQQHLRPDLKILVMSATLDTGSIAALFGTPPVIQCTGRSFPVTTHYARQPVDALNAPAVAQSIVQALRNEEGDILVFLPGQREIRKLESLLMERDLPGSILLCTLYGDASPQHQRAAFVHAPAGKRKVILSTNIAETSITIPGVRAVIDSGYMRAAQFDPRRGMSGLTTVRVSKASADQRQGRAGRDQPGSCYRLFTEEEFRQFSLYTQPEILLTDLAPLALDMALWGESDGKNLKFLDPPPAGNLTQAHQLLRRLGALDANNKITEHGKSMAALNVHPRLAHMLIEGKKRGFGPLACDIAAMLEERDVLRGRNESENDLSSRYSAVVNGTVQDRHLVKRIHDQSAKLKKMLQLPSVPFGKIKETHSLGLLLAMVYPDRAAKRRQNGQYQLSGNTVGALPKGSVLSSHEYLAVCDVDGAGSEVRIFLAEPLSKDDIYSAFKDQIEEKEEITWNEKEGMVVARRIEAFGALELSSKKIGPDPEECKNIILAVIQREGIDSLPWDSAARSLQSRSEWLRSKHLVDPSWPDLSDRALTATLEHWLRPYLDGITNRTQIKKIAMETIIRGMFSYQQLQQLDRLAPTHLTVPTGSRITIDYAASQPALSVRLQEMFGETETPTIGGGKEKVLIHLLSPARRVLAVTQDLPSFWKNAYPDVRKDMRGQYPKHVWPEDPLSAIPTRKTKKYHT
jgi:ATP-dependent helicase HrpB